MGWRERSTGPSVPWRPVRLTLEEPEAFTSPPESAEEAEFLDQATGLRTPGPLDPERVRAARAEEWEYMELKIMEEASLDEALAETGRQPIPTRWVDLDKGDKDAPKVRSRPGWSVRRPGGGPHWMWRTGAASSLLRRPMRPFGFR